MTTTPQNLSTADQPFAAQIEAMRANCSLTNTIEARKRLLKAAKRAGHMLTVEQEQCIAS
jgi:hypothetical protein